MLYSGHETADAFLVGGVALGSAAVWQLRGGVYGFINRLGPIRRARLNDAITQRLARQRPHGRARYNELRRTEALAAARIDSLQFGASEQRRFAHRSNKIERRLYREGQ